MKLECSSIDFCNALESVSKKMSDGKKELDTIYSVKMLAKGDKLTFSSVEKGIVIVVDIKANIINEGEALIDCRQIIDVLSKVDSILYLEKIDDKKLSIKYDNSYVEFLFVNEKGYEPDIDITTTGEFKIKKSILKDLLRRTKFVVNINANSEEYKNIFIEKIGSIISAHATNNYNLSSVTHECYADGVDHSFWLSYKIADILVENFDDINEDVYIKYNPSAMVFKFSNKIIYTTLPKIQKKMGKFKQNKVNTKVIFDKKLLKNSLNRIEKVIKNNKTSIAHFEFDGNKLKINASSNVISNIEEIVSISLEGNNISLDFSIKNIIEYLNITNEDYVTLYIKDGISALILSEDINKYMYVFLPAKSI